MSELLLQFVPAVIAGGVLLWWGGDKLVDHASHLARTFRVPKHVVGAVILGFGTSLPELLVCLSAAFHGNPGLAIGNVVGSNIANVGLILGVAAWLAPVVVEPKLLRLDLPMALVASIVIAVAYFPGGGQLTRLGGAGLLAVFGVYMTLSLVSARSHRRATRSDPPSDRHPGKDTAWVVFGLALVAAGARLFEFGASGVAESLGVPHEVIGLSVVALGTSMPELVTTIQAARQGHPELAVGNVAGSNVFNILLVLGATGVAHPVPISADMAIDTVWMVGFAIFAFPILTRGTSIPRKHGVLLLAGYAAYLAWLVLSGRELEAL